MPTVHNLRPWELYNFIVKHLTSTGATDISYFQLVMDIHSLTPGELSVIEDKINAGTFFDESGEIMLGV